MPLDQHEWDLVCQLVLDDLVGTDNPFQTLKTYFPEDIGNWHVTNVASDNARMIVNLARGSSPADDEPLSIRLLGVLARLPTIQVAKPAELAKLTEYLERLRGEKEALDKIDPYQARVLPGSGQVFIDRLPVRGSLRRMVVPEPGRPQPIVLRVIGDRDVGKSYTYQLIQHLAAPCGFAYARVVLDRSSTASDVMRELQLQIARESLPDDAIADPIKRLRYWALWVAQQAQLTPEQWWWFVFDQCDELDPGSDAVELIAQLSSVVAEMSLAGGVRRPRLLLLGYGDNLADLPLPPKQVVWDTVSPAGEQDLRDFFTVVLREAHERLQNGGGVDEARLAEHVDVAVREVLAAADASRQQGAGYMRAIATAAEGVLDVYAG
ncbi:hypothetical protein [Jiangella mangrovi]|uniref:ATP-binding protein n=1 Tax=Jiangella mangrovi TaxID=1524084 RepID=A0A7W9LNF2_9ACTN|nr:hypothetical protein [Jiangella mangrovi]MBB5790184.1 hypothetical protein [Jiangella mangrovi]